MARTVAPFMSLDASGTLGKTLTASRWKGRPYMRLRVIPSNPRSAAQTGIRAVMRFLAQQWALLSSPTQASWADLAAAGNYSPFNAFVAYNMAQLKYGNMPSEATPALRTGTAPTGTAITATGGVRTATVVIENTTVENAWAMLLCRDLNVMATPTVANCIAVLPFAGDGVDVTYVDQPLTPNTYNYWAVPFSTTGKLFPPIGVDSATVT